ncbi:hypothetical protein BCR34DRAFT_599052 [Clohesyomyces aquaticus]|uniref:C2H2-type domain-containing protein n=1 Tax=Clohesyomyces aquaticus TaxID=1231657 RepID=A0A1Y1ZWP9_9PLEO|nr:hypothetical protein BCR34DRAFT_599052 [Clohesyomyces aquaticus]
MAPLRNVAGSDTFGNAVLGLAPIILVLYLVIFFVAKSRRDKKGRTNVSIDSTLAQILEPFQDLTKEHCSEIVLGDPQPSASVDNTHCEKKHRVPFLSEAATEHREGIKLGDFIFQVLRNARKLFVAPAQSEDELHKDPENNTEPGHDESNLYYTDEDYCPRSPGLQPVQPRITPSRSPSPPPTVDNVEMGPLFNLRDYFPAGWFVNEADKSNARPLVHEVKKIYSGLMALERDLISKTRAQSHMERNRGKARKRYRFTWQCRRCGSNSPGSIEVSRCNECGQARCAYCYITRVSLYPWQKEEDSFASMFARYYRHKLQPSWPEVPGRLYQLPQSLNSQTSPARPISSSVHIAGMESARARTPRIPDPSWPVIVTWAPRTLAKGTTYSAIEDIWKDCLDDQSRYHSATKSEEDLDVDSLYLANSYFSKASLPLEQGEDPSQSTGHGFLGCADTKATANDPTEIDAPATDLLSRLSYSTFAAGAWFTPENLVPQPKDNPKFEDGDLDLLLYSCDIEPRENSIQETTEPLIDRLYRHPKVEAKHHISLALDPIIAQLTFLDPIPGSTTSGPASKIRENPRSAKRSRSTRSSSISRRERNSLDSSDSTYCLPKRRRYSTSYTSPDHNHSEDTSSPIPPVTVSLETLINEPLAARVEEAPAAAPRTSDDRSASFKCPRCADTFATIGKLNSHTNRKHDRRFECSICPMKFNLRADLQRHQRTVHKDSKPPVETFRCPNSWCKKPEQTFTRKDNFDRHVKSCTERLRKSE